MSKTKSNVVALPIPAQGDKAQANQAGAAQRIEILDAIDTAEDLRGTALVEALKMTARFGRTSEKEVREHYTRCDSPSVYASYFNRGAKVMEIVGEKLALQAIDNAVAAAKGGAGFTRALGALKSIIDEAKKAGAKQLNNRDGAAAVKRAVAFTVQQTARKSAAKKRGTVAQDSKTMAAAALESGKGHREMAAFIRLASQNAQRLPELQGRESVHREALKALAHASEVWSCFLK